MEKPIQPLSELFPFEYMGGGYFRQKGIAKGVSAEILHSAQAIEYIYDKMKEIHAKAEDKQKDTPA